VVGLSDFGLASIIDARGDQTASRDALTPAFAAPESFRGEAPTVRADSYALAATLYALLTGRPPTFGADGRVPSLMTIMAMHDKPVDDVPGTPPEFMALLRRSLAPDPGARPQTAAAFRDALLALPGPPTAPTTPSIAPAPQAPAPQAPAAMPVLDGTQTTNLTGSYEAVRLFPHTAAPGAVPGATATNSPAHAEGTNGSPAPVGAFGIATVQAGCPAASVPAAHARCPASPECWAGLVEISGVVSAESLPCDQAHYWETFAIAIMPAGAQTVDEPTLAENPTVRAVCSLPILLDSRRVDARRIRASSWQIEVLPPTEAAYNSGARTYRCVADVTGSQANTSQFRR
jgi:hypothetical protein